MNAGDVPYIWSFAYDADDNIPIAAANAKYYPGILINQMKSTAFTKAAFETYWLADNANPSGVHARKREVMGLSCEFGMVDAIGPYLGLGKTTSGTDWLVQGSVSGDVDQIIAHIENNLKGREQAVEFYAKAVKGKMGTGIIKTSAGQIQCLTCGLDFVSPRPYNMTVDSVLRSTYEPIFRGSKSPKNPYVVKGNSGITLTYNSLTLSKFFADYAVNWENDIGVLLDESSSFWGSEILNGGHRKFSDLAIDFAIPAAASIGDLDNLEDSVDSTTKADLTLKVPRRHANDFVQLVFKDAYLVQNPIPGGPRGESSARTCSAVWTGITDIQITERTVTAAGGADANVAADYNQA